MNAPIQQFNPTQIAIIDHNGSKWLTAEQLGLALGFSDKRARDGVNNLYNRHIDEFSEQDSTTIKLMAVDGKQRETRIFSHTGCNLLSFFANTPNAKQFRKWAARVLAGESQPHAQMQALKAAYLASNPEAAKLLRYLELDLNHAEIGKLLGISGQAVRDRLKKLAKLGLADYTPNPALSERGKLGNAAKQAQRAFLANQQSLALEG